MGLDSALKQSLNPVTLIPVRGGNSSVLITTRSSQAENMNGVNGIKHFTVPTHAGAPLPLQLKTYLPTLKQT